MNEINIEWQQRTELLLGKDKMKRLRHAHVLVVGLGGVGAYAAEMICRAGVGRMTIVDADIVQPSNINRQLPALHSASFFHGHNTPVRGEVPRNHTGENVVSRYQHLFPFIRRIIQQDIFQGCHRALFALFVFPYETSLRICLILAA